VYTLADQIQSYSVLRNRMVSPIPNPVSFLFRNPGPRSRIPDPGSPTHIFEKFNFLCKKYFHSLTIFSNFFKNKTLFNFLNSR